MAFFPDNPTVGQTYTIGNFTWTWNGSAWLKSSGGAGGTSYDEPAESTGYFGLPVGTTAQRPETPAAGMIRYNSTSGYAEVYTANGWGIFGAFPPTISSVSPTGYVGSSGTQFDISGTNFTSDASVSFILSNGTVSAAGSFTYINSSLIQATTGQEYVEAQGPLDVRVSQASGIATVADAIAVGFSPTWVTAAGSLGDVYYEDDQAQAVSFTVEATDPEGTTVTYSTESTLPTALTLNSSTGVISGSLDPIVSPVVTNNFTVTATEGTGKTANRTFSIVRRWRDGSSSSQYGVTAAQIKSLTGTNDNGYYWLNLGNSQGPTEVYCIMDSSYDSGGWMMWYGNKVGTILSTQRISSDTLNVSSSTPMLDWYNLNYAMRSGITAISTQGKTLIGTHNNTAVQGWAILQRTGGATGYVWDSTSHTTGNFRFENLFTMTSSNGTTDASVDVGITNYTQSVGGDFGIAVDTLDHHDNSNYYMLNNSCASQYIYEHGFGYKATTALSGFNSTTTSCTQSNTNSFGFFIAQR